MKEKKLEEDGAGSNAPQSAFLGPTLWDKTLPYDGDNFQLEYMDLEEFLSENGIPANPQSEQSQITQQPLQQSPTLPSPPSVVDLSNRASTSVHADMVTQGCLQSPSRAGTHTHTALLKCDVWPLLHTPVVYPHFSTPQPFVWLYFRP